MVQDDKEAEVIEIMRRCAGEGTIRERVAERIASEPAKERVAELKERAVEKLGAAWSATSKTS